MSLLLVGSALVGAGMGLYQNAQRKQDAERAAMQANVMYEHELKARKANRAILEGQLTIGAMQNTANSREAAIQVAQQEGMQEAALGTSGMSGGTPFYQLDSVVQENTRKLAELSAMQNIDFSGKVAQANAQIGIDDMNLQNAIWNLQDADEQLSYVNSPVADVLSMGTGAFAGMTMANNLNTAVTQMTGKDIEGHVSGLFAKQPQTTMTQGGYLPQLNGPITPPVPANRYLPAGRMTANGYLPQLTGYTDYMGMNSAKPKGIGSDSLLGKPLLQF